MTYPDGFKPCFNCRRFNEPGDLCDMCEMTLERWEPENAASREEYDSENDRAYDEWKDSQAGRWDD